MDREAWWATFPCGHKESNTTEELTYNIAFQIVEILSHVYLPWDIYIIVTLFP